MLKKKLTTLAVAIGIALSISIPAFASHIESETTMENAGAYLFDWRPIDCGNGRYFAIIAGGDTLYESNVILKRGYDYAYTFYPNMYSRPWGQIPDLVNINGVWGIPENWTLLPENSQSTLQLVLITNNNNYTGKERYIDVVRLPGGVSAVDLPAEVRKYLINADGSDAGAYSGTETTGWIKNEYGQWRYRKPDGTFVSDGWLKVDENSYYMNSDGIMLTDTISPDGVYVNTSGEKTSYMPGWIANERGWKYVLKNGYYAASTWIQDTDGKWYYFDMGGYMAADENTADGYYVGPDGVWNGQPSTISDNVNLGPGMTLSYGWEESNNTWKYKQKDGTYVTDAWKQDNGNWYYFGENSIMVTNQETPDGYYVNAEGVWVQ